MENVFYKARFVLNCQDFRTVLDSQYFTDLDTVNGYIDSMAARCSNIAGWCIIYQTQPNGTWYLHSTGKYMDDETKKLAIV